MTGKTIRTTAEGFCPCGAKVSLSSKPTGVIHALTNGVGPKGEVGCDLYDAIDPESPNVGAQMAAYAQLVVDETARRNRS